MEKVEEPWNSLSHWGPWAPKPTCPLGPSTSPFLCTCTDLGMTACDLDSAASGTELLPASLPPLPPRSPGAGLEKANKSPGPERELGPRF